MSIRIQKVNMEIKRQVTEIIHREIDNPGVVMVSITRVETSPDLREARVHFSLLHEEGAKDVGDILNKMSGFIRAKLGKRLRIKILPRLIFVHDESIKYSVDIYRKIEDLKENKD